MPNNPGLLRLKLKRLRVRAARMQKLKSVLAKVSKWKSGPRSKQPKGPRDRKPRAPKPPKELVPQGEEGQYLQAEKPTSEEPATSLEPAPTLESSASEPTSLVENYQPDEES